MDNRPVREQGDCFATSELDENVRIRHEQHLFNLVQLLKADNTDLARAGSWFEHEAELSLGLLPDQDHVSRHGHSLHRCDLPVLFNSFVVVEVRALAILILIGVRPDL